MKLDRRLARRPKFRRRNIMGRRKDLAECESLPDPKIAQLALFVHYRENQVTARLRVISA